MKISTPYSKPCIAAFLSLIALLAFASCGDSETEPTATEEPTATATLTSFQLTVEADLSDFETCYKPVEALPRDVANKLEHPGEGLRAFYLLRHPHASNEWTLAADLEGTGFDGIGPIALFSVTGSRVGNISIDNIQPMNDLAIDHIAIHSSFADAPDGAYERIVERRKSGLQILNQCIEDEINANPDTIVYRAE